MIRYRSRSFGTIKDLPKFKHVARLGKLLKVVGYRYQSTRKGLTSNYTTNHEAVKVVGENGYCRFDALCWSYSGQGPRGLVELLKVCGLDESQAKKIAFTSFRGDNVGIDWTYQFA